MGLVGSGAICAPHDMVSGMSSRIGTTILENSTGLTNVYDAAVENIPTWMEIVRYAAFAVAGLQLMVMIPALIIMRKSNSKKRRNRFAMSVEPEDASFNIFRYAFVPLTVVLLVLTGLTLGVRHDTVKQEKIDIATQLHSEILEQNNVNIEQYEPYDYTVAGKEMTVKWKNTETNSIDFTTTQKDLDHLSQIEVNAGDNISITQEDKTN